MDESKPKQKRTRGPSKKEIKNEEEAQEVLSKKVSSTHIKFVHSTSSSKFCLFVKVIEWKEKRSDVIEKIEALLSNSNETASIEVERD